MKDLILQDEPFAISSEFLWYAKEIQDSDIEEYAKLVVYNIEHGGDIDVPITDEIEITGFSFVGNPGNAKSGGYEPSLLVRNEEEHLNKKEILDKVLAHLSAEVAPEEAVTEEVVATDEVVEVEEPVVEEVKEETAVEGDTLAQAIASIEALTTEVEALKTENAELKAKVAEKEASENAVDEQLAKLATLLEKANPVVEKAEIKEEQPVNRFGRVRFGGQ